MTSHSSENFSDPTVRNDLARSLWSLLTPFDANVFVAGSFSAIRKLPLEAVNSQQAIYVDTTLPKALFPRAIEIWALVNLWYSLPSHGFSFRRIHHLLEAECEVYEAVPIAGMPPLARVAKSWIVLLMRGGRVALGAWRTGVPAADAIVAIAEANWDRAVGATIYLGSGHVYRLAAGDSMLRIPCGDSAVARLERGFHALSHAASLDLDLDIPRALLRFVVSRWVVFAESRVPHHGFDYLNMTPAEHESVRSQAIRQIVRIHEASCVIRQCAESDLEALFGRPVRRLINASEMACIRDQLEGFLRAVTDIFLGRDVALVLLHGDCKIANFLHDGKFNVRGLVDWDRAEINGLPAVDLVHYHAFDDLLEGRGTIAEMLFARAQRFEVEPAFSLYRKRFLLDGVRCRSVAAMGLILHVAEQLDAGNTLANKEMNLNPAVIERALQWIFSTNAPTD